MNFNQELAELKALADEGKTEASLLVVKLIDILHRMAQTQI